MEFKTIVSAILVIAVVIFAIVFLQKGWPLVKSILGFGEETQETLETKATIQDRFNSLVDIYTKCINSEKTNCICTKDKFIRFPSDYKLEIKDKTISLMQGDKEIYKSNFNSNINCFITSSKDGNGNFKPITGEEEPYIIDLKIFFDKPESIYLKESGVGIPISNDLTKNVPWLYKLPKNEICLTIETYLKKDWLLFRIEDKEIKKELNSLNVC